MDLAHEWRFVVFYCFEGSKLLMRSTAIIFALTTLVFTIGAAESRADVWEFDCVDAGTCPSSNGAGTMISSTFLFNDITLDFSWTATFEPNAGVTPDGFWLVVDHGPEPDETDRGLAIVYGDGATNKAVAYVYDDGEGEDSWDTPGTFIDGFHNSVFFTPLAGGNVQLDFSINVSSINNEFPDPWQGLYYQDTIGFWAAALGGTAFTFDSATWEITDFTFTNDSRTSYDRHDRATTQVPVPEPSTLALFGIGGLGLVLWARRRRSSNP